LDGTKKQAFAIGINPLGKQIDISKKVSWSTSNTNILTIDSTGVLTSISVGKVKVIATDKKGKTKAENAVEVVDYNLGGDVSMKVGEQFELQIATSNNDIKRWTWETNNVNIAGFVHNIGESYESIVDWGYDPSVTVRAVGVGQVTITVQAVREDGVMINLSKKITVIL